MLIEILHTIAAASMIGCITLFLVPKGGMHEVVKMAVGILLLLTVLRPLLSLRGISFELPALAAVDAAALQEVQEEQYYKELTREAERKIESYFAARGMQVNAQLILETESESRVILCPMEAYDWTQNDAKEFADWSGIPQERQEWIW